MHLSGTPSIWDASIISSPRISISLQIAYEQNLIVPPSYRTPTNPLATWTTRPRTQLGRTLIPGPSRIRSVLVISNSGTESRMLSVGRASSIQLQTSR